MLDSITKKNIDNCRDVLVGKVPDPKSQIEQITLALIYKFMDDMDKESVEVLKGKAKFFVGEFAKYGWRQLFDPNLGGKEMLELYSNALENLQTNDNIPELFRNIFKNAYLPYKDPSTLRLFLKYINEFEYTHSEKLGDAFEYLLSVMSSQGDAGQFRTPRHVIDFIVACLDPKKNETVADPACGTAGFLLSAYKYIVQQNTDKRSGDLLTPDQRKKMASNIVGYDISPDMVRLSLVNMYLHGFATPKIFEYDTLSSEDRWNETFDVILANPPFMTPKGGIRPHKKFGVQANKAEVLFTNYIAEHLNKNGRAGIVVPNGIVATTQSAYKQLRKLLVEDSLIAVISLPAGCFNPYSGVKTSILLLDKGLAKKSKEVLFIKVNNDGYDLGAQRREIDKNDLPTALKAFNDFKQHLTDDSDFIPENYNDLCLLVEKEKILANKEVVLSGDRYKENLNNNSFNYEPKSLGELCELYQPKTISAKDFNEFGKYKVFGANGVIGRFDEYNHEHSQVLITCRGATCGTINLSEPFSWITGNSMVAKPKDFATLNQMFLYHILKHSDLSPTISGSAQPQITRQSLEPFEIPLPPIEIQEVIVNEIEGYQKIIDGAKMVVENYKPTITINPDWEMVELGEVIELQRGYDLPKQEWKEGNVPIVGSNGIIGFHNIGKHKGVGVVTGRSGTIGKVHYIDYNSYWPHNTSLFVKDFKGNNPKFIKVLLESLDLKKLTEHSAAVPSLDRKLAYLLKTYKVPIEEQTQIVQRIEQEQALVNANKQLITIFEQKIKDKINAVWGVNS